MCWHAQYKTGGIRRLNQGCFKSFPIQTDGLLLTAMRYLQRNPVRVNLVDLAADWQYEPVCLSLLKSVELRVSLCSLRAFFRLPKQHTSSGLI